MVDSYPLTKLHKQRSRGKASLSGVTSYSVGSTTIEHPLTHMLGHNSIITNVLKIGNRTKVSYI